MNTTTTTTTIAMAVAVAMLCISCCWTVFVVIRTGRPASPSSAKTIESSQDLVIVSSHFDEDIRWLEEARVPTVVCSKTMRSPHCEVGTNRGREASAYLRFIVDNYDWLPGHVAFVHGHRHAWHQRHGADILDLIQDCAQYRRYGFVPLNNTFIDDRDSKNHAMRNVLGVWDTLFRPYLERDPPKHLLHDCCAQFIVSRHRIRAHPIEAYRHWLDFTTKTSSPFPDDDIMNGLVFEYVWHVIFGEPDVVRKRDVQKRFAGCDDHRRLRKRVGGGADGTTGRPASRSVGMMVISSGEPRVGLPPRV